jgi:NADH-quinone oxidoreductase subunit L
LLTFFGTGEPDRIRVPRLMSWPLVVLAVPAALLGFLALLPDSLASWLASSTPAEAAAALYALEYGEPGELLHPATILLSTLAVLVGAGGVLLAWRRSGGTDPAALLGRFRPALAAGLGVDAFYARYVVRPVRALARLVVLSDRDVVDFYVLGAGRTARLLGGLLRRVQTGNVQTYLSLLLAGVVLVAVLAGEVT